MVIEKIIHLSVGLLTSCEPKSLLYSLSFDEIVQTDLD